MRTEAVNGFLLLEDGSVYHGQIHGPGNPVCGELVFNTSMTGYQEVMTDPSYFGQTVVLTFPEIGIYGTQHESNESLRHHAACIIVKNLSLKSWNQYAAVSMDTFLLERDLTVLSGIDTRKLTLDIREKGPQKSIIAPETVSIEQARRILLSGDEMLGANLVPKVSCSDCRVHGDGDLRVGLLDFGVKTSIINQLVERNCRVYQFPWNTSFEEMKKENLHGFLFSNGPGDPDAVPGVREVVLEASRFLPCMAICLGYQILALSLGGATYKLPFGHRGGNHPVKDLETGRIMITAQNHGFAVEMDSLPKEETVHTQVSMFDGSLEGFRMRNTPVFGVQYHPEAGPGPSDAMYLFDQFIDMMEAFHA